MENDDDNEIRTGGTRSEQRVRLRFPCHVFLLLFCSFDAEAKKTTTTTTTTRYISFDLHHLHEQHVHGYDTVGFFRFGFRACL